MIRNFIFATAIISSLTASAFAQTSVLLNLKVDGKKRAALLRVPMGVEKPPVVFYVHGATDSGGWFQKMGNTDATADREKYLAVYACASSDCGSGIWEDMQGTSNFRYIFALLDSVDARYKVDRNRVYMTAPDMLDSIIGHRHYWPRPANGNQADEIWAFLKRYSLGKTTGPHPRAAPKPRVPITISYTSGMIRLAGLRGEARVEVVDNKGELIATAETRRHQAAFKGRSGGVYLVTVRGDEGVIARKIIIPGLQ